MESENESKVTEDTIDKLKLREAVTLCKKHKIQLSRDIKLQQMKWLLKRRLLCTAKTRREIIDGLDWDAYVDDNRRKALVEIYDNTMENAKHIMTMKDPVIEELKKIFPDICHMLEEEKQNINKSKAPILVLGETGSGKSSFINLLLGCDILPCSLLSNTHVICEIRNSNDASSYAFLYHCKDDEITRVDGTDSEGFKKELPEYIQAVDDGNKPVYKRAQIYLSSDILKSGLMIVDSPGIGEAKSMENIVLEYILNACTFIYIVDSTSAGGMQERMQKLVHKVHKKALDEQREYRPKSAIFVLNKWDGVPYDERKEVWEDSVNKIKSCWPDCQESQIYKFSTLEAAYIQNEGGVSPKFQPILEQISHLIPLGREILVLRGYRFLENFASKCIHCFGTHLTQIKLSAEEREQMRTETKDRLHTLKTENDSFFQEQTTQLETAINAIAKDLGEYIRRPENLAKVCQFSSSEIPRKTVWKEMAVAVRSHVYEKIMKMIKTWEEEESQFKTLGTDIARSIEQQFPKFQAEIFELQHKMSNSVRNNSDGVLEEEEATLLPGFLRRRLEGLTFGAKMGVGIVLAPVLVVSMAIRLPHIGLKSLKRTVQTLINESDFQRADTLDDKIKLCEKYAKTTVATITDKIGLVKIIEEDIQPLFQYLRQQRQRMEAQIQSDLDLLKTLKEEQRCDDDIEKTYEPLQAKFEIICRRLHHFLYINIPEQILPLDNKSEIPYHQLEIFHTKVICSGFAATIVQGKSKQPARTFKHKDVSVRKLKDAVHASTVNKHIAVQHAYSTIKQESIVRCFAVSSYEGVLYQVLEPLQCSLRSYLRALEEEMRVNKCNTVLSIMKSVMTGLKFLHEREKKLVSLDLSMDTVAVDSNGIIKLTNISKEKPVLLKPDYESEKITVGKFVHFHPHFFGYTTKTVRKFGKQKVKTSMAASTSPIPVKDGKKQQTETAPTNKKMVETLYARDGETQPETSYIREPGNEEPSKAADGLTTSISGSKLGESATYEHNIMSRSTKSVENLESSTSRSKSSVQPKAPRKNSNPNKSVYSSTDSIDSTITSRTEHTYTTKDDMYAVGIMMWELWKERPLESQTLDYAIPNDAVIAHREGELSLASEIMEKFMKKFQPKVESPFDVSDLNAPEGAFIEEWWSTLRNCLYQKMSSSEWLKLWDQMGTYPRITLMFSEQHFSTSPGDHAE